MTHDGPFESKTTTYKRDDGIVKFGSPGLAKLLKDNSSQILLNLHGHCHLGNTFDYELGPTVINPGSLSVGSFIVLDLAKIDGKWKLDSVTKKF